MATELAKLAALIPIPMDARFGPCRAYVGLTEGRVWQVYFGLDGGRAREWVGPTFPPGRRSVRQAMTLASLLNGEAR